MNIMKNFLQKHIVEVAVEAYKQAKVHMEEGTYDVDEFERQMGGIIRKKYKKF